MDPITSAARAFLAEAKVFWRACPGRLLPMIAEPSERGEVVKALRLAELAPENRRPLFLHEAPFANADTYFDGLVAALVRDYEAIREGVAGEGVMLPAFSMNVTAPGPVERAVLTAERAAMLLGARFDGILVALMPEDVASAAAWRESVGAMSRMPRSPQVRLAVHAPPGGHLRRSLGDRGARLQIDQAALLAYLKGLGAPTSNGPAAPSDRPARVTHEASTIDRATKLRTILLDAADASARGNHVEAARAYHDARALCAAGELVIEEAMVLLGLAGACLAANHPLLAVESYRQAAELATSHAAWNIACQAWLGVGGAYLATKTYELAAQAYRAAAEAAECGEVAVLRIEALRMAGTCLLLGGSEDAALLVWKEAVDRRAQLSAQETAGAAPATPRVVLPTRGSVRSGERRAP